MWPLDEGLLQHSDSAMNLNITARGKIAFAETSLMRYRVNRKGRSTGASNRSQITKTREAAEVALLMDYAERLLAGDPTTFMRLFAHLDLMRDTRLTQDTVPYWLARIALTSDQYDKRLWGLRRLIGLMNDRSTIDQIRKEAGFTFKDMLSLANDVHAKDRFYHKFRKYRKWTYRLGIVSALLAILFITFSILTFI